MGISAVARSRIQIAHARDEAICDTVSRSAGTLSGFTRCPGIDVSSEGVTFDPTPCRGHRLLLPNARRRATAVVDDVPR
ncbi:hypothetical protein C440_03428 [Haloferax mucosum ATCC BAA-1512]|uniref:Uncharacterized protein n=1 Tax=Haloferax mucosum ATCC BAA-1512 TaxID=662479 RepID=M0ILR0_9EURY|nr:hypothetical protein C440_03428 [Haloferax mucosum ATCC BAA-1512]